jgi:hypothetical protein
MDARSKSGEKTSGAKKNDPTMPTKPTATVARPTTQPIFVKISSAPQLDSIF